MLQRGGSLDHQERREGEREKERKKKEKKKEKERSVGKVSLPMK